MVSDTTTSIMLMLHNIDVDFILHFTFPDIIKVPSVADFGGDVLDRYVDQSGPQWQYTGNKHTTHLHNTLGETLDHLTSDYSRLIHLHLDG